MSQVWWLPPKNPNTGRLTSFCYKRRNFAYTILRKVGWVKFLRITTLAVSGILRVYKGSISPAGIHIRTMLVGGSAFLLCSIVFCEGHIKASDAGLNLAFWIDKSI